MDNIKIENIKDPLVNLKTNKIAFNGPPKNRVIKNVNKINGKIPRNKLTQLLIFLVKIISINVKISKKDKSLIVFKSVSGNMSIMN